MRHCYASSKSCDTFTVADSYLCHDDADDTARLSLHICIQGVTGFSSIVGSGVVRTDPLVMCVVVVCGSSGCVVVPTGHGCSSGCV